MSGGTTRWSVASDGSQGDGRSTNPTLAGGGHTVAFHSFATNLVPGDTNNAADVFVRDAGGGSSVTAYTHDRLSRLTGADGPDGSRSYAYDPIGNRLEVIRDGTPTAFAYDAADRLLSVRGTAVSVDAAGNLVARGTDAFSYDAANRLVGASMGGVTQTSTYDGDGTRVATTVDSTTTSYVHDLAAGLPLVIDDGVHRYVWGPAGLAYSVDLATGALEVVHADHLGSVRTTTDAAGAVTATARYDEFGVPLATTGASGSPFGFTGEPTDPTGLVHLRARSYDPELGRFLNRDPWAGVAQAPSSLNRYVYALNNPVRYSDPSGLRPVEGGEDVVDWGAVGKVTLKCGYGAYALGSYAVTILGSAAAFASTLAGNPVGPFVGSAGVLVAVYNQEHTVQAVEWCFGGDVPSAPSTIGLPPNFPPRR